MSGGAADLDGRLQIGDEITHINHNSVVDSSHRVVISLMGQAAAVGEVILGIERKTPMLETLSPTSGVAGIHFDPIKHDLGDMNDGVQNDRVDYPTSDIPQGVRDIVIQRPNMQTSFGFVLQSNTLRSGCIICKCQGLTRFLPSLSTLMGSVVKSHL